MRLMLIVAMAVAVYGSVGEAGPNQSQALLFRAATLAIIGDADSVVVRLRHPDGEVCPLGGGRPEGIQPRCGFAYVYFYMDDPAFPNKGWYLDVDEDAQQPFSIAFEAIGASRVGVSAYWQGRSISCASEDSLELRRGERAGWDVAWSKKTDSDTCWVHLKRSKPDSSELGKVGQRDGKSSR